MNKKKRDLMVIFKKKTVTETYTYLEGNISNYMLVFFFKYQRSHFSKGTK